MSGTSRENPLTINEIANYYCTPNFNNFYFHLPGGAYRGFDCSYLKELQTDLDREAARLSIDTGAIFKERSQGEDLIVQAIRLMLSTGNTPKVKMLNDEGEVLRQRASEKMIPLFFALVALGYHHEILIR